MYLIHFILHITKTDGRRQGRIAHEFQEYHEKNTYTMVLNCDISNLKQKMTFKKMKLIILIESDYTIMHSYIDYMIKRNC